MKGNYGWENKNVAVDDHHLFCYIYSKIATINSAQHNIQNKLKNIRCFKK